MERFSNYEKGILLVCVATFVFASQDAVTKFLGMRLPLLQFIGIRYFFFFLVALWYAHVNGGIKDGFKTKALTLQLSRGLLLAVELWLFAYVVRFVGVGYMHSVFSAYPLIIIALSPLLLGEHIGWRRWCAVAFGFIGTLIIIGPVTVGDWRFAIIPLVCALLFAIYSIFTRKVAQKGDSSATSLLYTALVGMVLFTPTVPFVWHPMEMASINALALLIILGASSHLLVIIAYGYAPAALLQPFNYFTMPWAILLGIMFFSEQLEINMLIGAAVVVISGLYVWWRERQLEFSSNSTV